MNTDQIEAFIRAAFTNSFSKAAEQLYTSQPAVSARIRSLENELSVKLFKRNGNGITLTKDGELFLPYAENILKNAEEAKLVVQKNKQKKTEEISIASVIIAANYILPSIVSEFNQAHPDIKLTVHTGHSHHILDMVLNHEVPFGISRAVRNPSINSITLMNDEMVLVTYPDHPFKDRDIVTLEEAAKEPLILFNRGSLDWALIDGIFNKLNITPNVVMEVDNIEMLKQLVKKKMGIAILPKFAVEEETKSHFLHVIQIENIPQIQRPFELIYLKGTEFDGMTKTFTEFIIQRFGCNEIIDPI